jgi:ABC-type nitrate/sulfonate/bicarbonate transport system substrate-binding protein
MSSYKPKGQKFLTGIGIVIVGLLLLPGPSARRACAEPPLRVGVYRGVISALIYVADAQGFFRKKGVNLAIKEYGTGVQALNDLIDDKVDIATCAEFAFVLQSFRQPSLRIPAAIWTGSNHDLMVRTDHGIRVPQDLKGKRVSVIRGSSTEFFLHHYLILNNIPAGSLKVIYLEPSAMVKALADGTIDAALSWPPYTTEMAKQLGSKVASWEAQSGQDYYIVLASKEGFLKRQPKAIEKFLAALIDADGYIARYPSEAQAILRQKLGVDAASALALWSRSRFEVQLTQDMLVLMELEAKWVIRNNLGQGKEMPNYLNFFYFGALDKVKPKTVSIVH